MKPQTFLKSIQYFSSIWDLMTLLVAFMPSRLFVELRAVLRTEAFPDQRQRFTGEARAGLLGYDKFNPTSYFF